MVSQILFAAFPVVTLGQTINYEAGVFPEEANPGWIRSGTFDVERWIEDGRFWQAPELGIWWPPPFGEMDWYERAIGEFSNSPEFVIQFRVESTIPGEVIDLHAVPAVVSAAGNSSALYHISISRDRVRFLRDTSMIMFVDIEPWVMHTYRVELQSEQLYSFYIDGELIDSGVPIGPYPVSGSILKWGARHYQYEQFVHWDYLRYGVIPVDHSGDFDSNGVVDDVDLYFFVDCLLGPDYDAAGPGCVFADMNEDGVADGRDIPDYIDAMLGA